MKDNKTLLIRDTITYLRQKEVLSSKFKIDLLKKTPKDSVKKKFPISKKKPPVSSAPFKSESKNISKVKETSSQATPPLLTDAIIRHLPHLKIINEIPQMRRALILCNDDSEAPFLNNLKQAINERLCPCTLTFDNNSNFNLFTCVITSKNLGLSHQIIVHQEKYYKNHPQRKRTLWTQICHMLSLKSS